MRMIGRKWLFSNFKCFFVRRKCFGIFIRVHIQISDVVVGWSQIRMIGRKWLLLNCKCFFVIRKCFGIFTHVENTKGLTPLVRQPIHSSPRWGNGLYQRPTQFLYINKQSFSVLEREEKRLPTGAHGRIAKKRSWMRQTMNESTCSNSIIHCLSHSTQCDTNATIEEQIQSLQMYATIPYSNSDRYE